MYKGPPLFKKAQHCRTYEGASMDYYEEELCYETLPSTVSCRSMMMSDGSGYCWDSVGITEAPLCMHDIQLFPSNINRVIGALESSDEINEERPLLGAISVDWFGTTGVYRHIAAFDLACGYDWKIPHKLNSRRIFNAFKAQHHIIGEHFRQVVNAHIAYRRGLLNVSAEKLLYDIPRNLNHTNREVVMLEQVWSKDWGKLYITILSTAVFSVNVTIMDSIMESLIENGMGGGGNFVAEG